MCFYRERGWKRHVRSLLEGVLTIIHYHYYYFSFLFFAHHSYFLTFILLFTMLTHIHCFNDATTLNEILDDVIRKRRRSRRKSTARGPKSEPVWRKPPRLKRPRKVSWHPKERRNLGWDLTEILSYFFYLNANAILQLLLRKKAAEELKKEQERKAAERRRIIEERCGKPKLIDEANEGRIHPYLYLPFQNYICVSHIIYVAKFYI